MNLKREKILTVDPNQKRIVLVDKQIINPIARSDVKLLYTDLYIHPLSIVDQQNTEMAYSELKKD